MFYLLLGSVSTQLSHAWILSFHFMTLLSLLSLTPVRMRWSVWSTNIASRSRYSIFLKTVVYRKGFLGLGIPNPWGTNKCPWPHVYGILCSPMPLTYIHCISKFLCVRKHMIFVFWVHPEQHRTIPNWLSDLIKRRCGFLSPRQWFSGIILQ